jgi:hypothetical protein
MKLLTKTTIDNYILQGIPVGDFLRNLLCDNWRHAIAHADVENKRDLAEICEYLRFNCPASCIGSADKYEEWIAHQGWQGLIDRGIVPANSNPLELAKG